MLKIQSLASGSKGNCTYIASETTAVLVDIGLSLPETLRRLQDANIDPKTISAVLITHEHSDHIKGVTAFLKRFKCHLFVHETAADTCREFITPLLQEQLHTFDTKFAIGDIVIDFFPVPHDSLFCFGYTFSNKTCKISLATDLGRCSYDILVKMTGSQVVLLEANHCLTKLHNNVKYPPWLKRRISGSSGHLSNAACGLAVYELARMGVQQFVLAHLSEENNSPTIAFSFVRDFLAKKGLQEGVDINIDIAHQHKVGTLFQVD